MQVSGISLFKNHSQLDISKMNGGNFAKTNLMSKNKCDSCEFSSKEKQVSFRGMKGLTKGVLGLAEFGAGGLGFVGALFTPAAPIAILAGAASLAGILIGGKNVVEVANGDDDMQIEKIRDGEFFS